MVEKLKALSEGLSVWCETREEAESLKEKAVDHTGNAYSVWTPCSGCGWYVEYLES